MNTKADLLTAYKLMLKQAGVRYWWPGETALEVAIGAILTQNTTWSNVTTAIANLKAEKLLDFEALRAISAEELAPHIRPSGYFNQKAQKIKDLIAFITENADSPRPGIDGLWAGKDLATLRSLLLKVRGIGPETADSILLYAGLYPTFVIDTYTKRIFSRHGMGELTGSYAWWQALFMENLPHDEVLFNDYHAQIVHLGKDYCKKTKPLCDKCPLAGFRGYCPPPQ